MMYAFILNNSGYKVTTNK